MEGTTLLFYGWMMFTNAMILITAVTALVVSIGRTR